MHKYVLVHNNVLRHSSQVGKLCDVDIKTYLRRLTDAERQIFMKKAGLNQGSLNHIKAGRPVESLRRIMRIADASDGMVEAKTLNPQAFSNSKAGRRQLEAFLASMGIERSAA